MRIIYKTAYASMLLVILATTMLASTVGVLTNFTTGTPISSADVNANFNALKNVINGNDALRAANTTNIAANATAIGANTTAIGTRVSKAGDTMTGALTVPSITYSTPQVASVTYAATSFSPENASMGFNKSSGNNGFTANNVGAGAYFHALTLPAGAVITSIQAYVYDNETTDLVDVRLENQGSLVTSIGTTAPQVGGYIQLNGPNINYTVLAGPVNYYQLEVWLSAASASLGFYSVKVNYTYTKP